MILRLIVIMGILSALFGCNNRESLGGNYVYNKKDKQIQYRYAIGGALLPSYKAVPTKYPKSFEVLSDVYAIDKSTVFYAGELVKGISPDGFQIVEEYPNLFAKNTKSKQLLYKDSLIDIDFQTIKIHSPNYVSDNNKVVFITKRGESKYGQFHKVSVTDATSFGEFNAKSRNGMAIGYDKHTIYLDGINTKIPSAQAQIIQLGLPTIILQNDVLHYIYPSYRKKETTFKDLQSPFVATSHGIIDSLMYDDFYHFSIQGFKEANQILNSSWIKDANGLHFVNDSRIHKVSNKQFAQYVYDEKYPKYLKTADSLIQVQTYPYKVIHYAAKAIILDDELVKDQNKIYYKGEEIKNADAITFARLPKSGGFVDKNFYYYGNSLYRKTIPSWAYQELLDGKNINDLFGIDMKYNHTVYKTYWNGFLVSFSLPTKENKSDIVQIVFKNIARTTIRLKRPIEEQLYISYKPHSRESPVYYADKTRGIKKENEYDYKNIKNEESIKFSFPINQKMIAKLTVEENQQQVLPFLILSDIEFPLERNDYNLYMEASNY